MSNLERERRARMKKGETPSEAYANVGESLRRRQQGVVSVSSHTPRQRTGEWGRRSSDNQAYPKTAGKEVLPQLDFPNRSPPMDDDGGEDEWETFKIMLIYEDDSVEMVPIVAKDHDDALNQALAERKTDPRLKIKTSIVHDGVGEVIGELVHGIEQGYTIGRKIVGTVGRGGARLVSDIGHATAEAGAGIAVGSGRTVAAYRNIGRQYTVGKLERLFNDMDSEIPTRRAVARRELQVKYPQIYKHIGWKRV